MKQYSLMDRLVEAGNGYLQVSAVRKHAISNYTLMKYLKTRGMARTAHGVYATTEAWPDDYYLLALRNGRIVFSHESALYLHGLMEHGILLFSLFYIRQIIRIPMYLQKDKRVARFL